MDDTKRKLNVAIVGCGAIGNKRWQSLPGDSLRYACDVDEKSAAGLASQASNCRATVSVQEVLEDSRVDAVIVATSSVPMAPIALRAVQAGKHVLLEKPGSTLPWELAEIESVAAKRRVVVRVGYNHRFHPAFRKAYELVETEDLGAAMFIRGRYGHGGRLGYGKEWRMVPKLSGGGELLDQGVHLIDLAMSFVGDFDTVEGHAASYFWNKEADDNAFLSLRTREGQTAWLQVSCTEWKNLFSFEIYFERAKLHIEGLGGSYGVERLYFYKMRPEMGPPETIIYEYPLFDTSWRLELDEFYQDIRLNRFSNPGLRGAVRVLEIVNEIYRMSGYRSSVSVGSL
jgi:predicted dehydrogenase